MFTTLKKGPKAAQHNEVATNAKGTIKKGTVGRPKKRLKLEEQTPMESYKEEESFITECCDDLANIEPPPIVGLPKPLGTAVSRPEQFKINVNLNDPHFELHNKLISIEGELMPLPSPQTGKWGEYFRHQGYDFENKAHVIHA